MPKSTMRGIAVVAAIFALGAVVSTASAATLSASPPPQTSPTPYPVGSGHQFRSTTTVQFAFSTGNINCAGLVANGVTAANTFSTTFVTIANLTANSTFFGSVSSTSTSSSACPSTISAISQCTASNTVPAYTGQAKVNSANTGVDEQIGPITIIANCISSSDGSTIANCKYITGTTTSGAAISGTSPFVTQSSGRAAASEITLTNQPFVKVSGPAACPPATAAAPGKVSTKLKLYTSTSASAPLIYAYQ